MGASSDHQDSSPSGKLLHCTPEFNEPLRGSPSGLPTFSFLSEKCGVRATSIRKLHAIADVIVDLVSTLHISSVSAGS